MADLVSDVLEPLPWLHARATSSSNGMLCFWFALNIHADVRPVVTTC